MVTLVTETGALVGVLGSEEVTLCAHTIFSHKPNVLWEGQPRPGRRDRKPLFPNDGREAGGQVKRLEPDIQNGVLPGAAQSLLLNATLCKGHDFAVLCITQRLVNVHPETLSCGE